MKSTRRADLRETSGKRGKTRRIRRILGIRAIMGTGVLAASVDDPKRYAEPWGGQIPMKRLPQQVYEYACHEGNDSLRGVLSGARYQESLEAEDRADPPEDEPAPN